MQKLFSGGELTQSLPNINLDVLCKYQDWYEKMKLLTCCIKFKDYGRALECLKERNEYLKEISYFDLFEKKEKYYFDLLSELFLFCQDGIETLSNFPVKKLMFQNKIKHKYKHGCTLKPVRNQHRFGKLRKL